MRLPKCPRCGGQLLPTLDGHGCLQCGHEIIEVDTLDLIANNIVLRSVTFPPRHEGPRAGGWHDIDYEPWARR
jgi:hypothetical protein